MKNSPPKLLIYTLLTIGIAITILFLKTNGTLDVLVALSSKNTGLLGIFLTGLLTGGLTCMAVQGGLLAATLAQREQVKIINKSERLHTAIPVLSFLLAKLASYTLLGLLLGAFGSLFKLSLSAQVIMQIAVAIFMIGTALAILDIHPVFRYFMIQPPHFLTRIIRKQSRSDDLFAPIFLGALTVFIPCGTTQAMMALAIASANIWFGASIMFVFVLGTSPVFFILALLASQLGSTLKNRFMKVASLGIILLALFNLNNALALAGSPITLDHLLNSKNPSQKTTPTVSLTSITILASQYLPNTITVKSGSEVTLRLKNESGQGCIQAFTIPSLGIQKVIPLGSSESVTFTAPQKTGDLAFMCSMGMYRGTIHII